MVKVEFTIEVGRPVSEVFSYIADVTNLPEWQSSAIEAKADGPMRQGTLVHERRKFLGRTMDSTLEVTAYEPDRRLDLKTREGPVPFEIRHTLESANGRTRIHFVGEGEPGGFFKFGEAFVRKQAERQFRGDFETLKDVLESG